jgi:hypothetical protein
MDMLCAANKTFDCMLQEVNNKEKTLREVYDIFPSAYPDYSDSPDIPLVFVFKKSEKEKAKDLKEKYGIPY